MDEEKKEETAGSVNEAGKDKDESWVCPKCSHVNNGNFCGSCGTPRPSSQEEKKQENVSEKKEEQPQQNTVKVDEKVHDAVKKTAAGQKPEKKEKHRKVVSRICEAVLVFAIGFGGGWLGSYAGSAEKIHNLEDEVSDLKDDVEKLQSENSLINGFENFFSGGENGGNGKLFGDYSEKGEDRDHSSSGDKSDARDQKAALGLIVQESDNGVTIVGFSDNSNAEDAGLKEGDVIKKLDGEDASTYSEIQSFLADKKVGDGVTVTVERDGKEVEAKITLVERQNSSFQITSPESSDEDSDKA